MKDNIKKIKVLFFGGLGNQLFQVAFAKNLEKKYKDLRIDFIDLTSFERVKRKWALDFFGIKGKKISLVNYIFLNIKRLINQQLNKIGIKKNFLNIVNESQYKSCNITKLLESEIIFDGYWQSEQYFQDNKELIKKTFLEYRKSYKTNDEDHLTVAVHIRLGDYINNYTSRNNHYVCDFEWYKKAINYFYLLNNNFKFIIFTDDHKYLKSKFKLDKKIITYIPSKSKNCHEDLLKMSLCDHFIISNSSYSWWASYLGEKPNSKVIAPKYWYPNKLTLELDIFRKNWILL